MSGAKPAQEPPVSLTRRLLWFAGMWLAGVAAVALLGLLIRALLA